MGEEPRSGVSRRGVLQAGLVAAAGVGVGGWSAADAATRPDRKRHLRKPGSRPYPELPAGHDSIPQIKHIIVLMMENHSYDNRFGMLRRPGADGFRINSKGRPLASNLYKNGDVQHAFHMPTTCQLNGHPGQDWLDSHTQLAHGRNSGFVQSGSGPVSMGYWDGTDQPFYYSMASVFPIGDRYFCSVLGQTYPNRRYLISATSLGMINDTTPAISDYPKNGTIFDKLDHAKVGWKNYVSGTAITASTLALYPALYFKHEKRVVQMGAPASSSGPATGFFADAASGNLPSFALLEPQYQTQSEENPQNIAVGEQFAASVINAVMSSPAWPDTLLIWNYDEHGGYYDHVPPPAALAPDDIKPKLTKGLKEYTGFRQYGFRVPMAVVSPYARPNYVSHRVMDHTSVCALVEHKWNLPAMTYRDANAWPMLDMVNLHHQAFLEPPTLAPPLLATDPSANACSTTGPGTIPPPGSVSPPRKHK